MHISSKRRSTSDTALARTRAARLQAFILGIAILTGTQLAAAEVLAFDRGLPIQNLNTDAGAGRSNVEWSDIRTLPETPWLPGDNFVLAGNGPFVVTTIRVWSTDSSALLLKGGAAGAEVSLISNTYTATPMSYINREGYEWSLGVFSDLYQIDFSVDIPLYGGVTYQFFLDGPAVAVGSDFVGAHLHASNAILSGSSQMGSDDTFLFLGTDLTVYTWNSWTGEGTYCPDCVGWDKTSDANVQVFAHHRLRSSAPPL